MSRINFNEQDNKTSKKGIHFYIALCICIISVGVAAFATYDSIQCFNKKEEVVASKTQQNEKASSQNKLNSNDNIVPELDTKNEENKSTSNLNEEPSEAIPTNSTSAGLIVYPTNKNIIKEYSGNNPVFSKTFGDWRTHNGIDLEAEQGSKIKAITNGTVQEIYNDPLLGTTMSIQHEGDFIAYYSGLGETTLVNVGDKVEAGQEIASINDIPCESADGYHLHLSVKKDDKFINPIDILG